jgi:transcriptional regulator with XRE-family HTH domain
MRNFAAQIGETIRVRRELLGLSQSQLTGFSGINTRTIQLIEQGKGNPSLDTLLQLANPLGLELQLVVKDLLKNSEL